MAVLERAAHPRAREVIPLFRVAVADAADVAASVEERLVADRTSQLGRCGWRRPGFEPGVRANERTTSTLQELVRPRQLRARCRTRRLASQPEVARLLQQPLQLAFEPIGETRLDEHRIGTRALRTADLRGKRFCRQHD